MENKKIFVLFDTITFIFQTALYAHSATNATMDAAMAPTLAVSSNAHTLGDIKQTFALVEIVVDLATTGHFAGPAQSTTVDVAVAPLLTECSHATPWLANLHWKSSIYWRRNRIRCSV